MIPSVCTGHSDVVMGVICTNNEELNKKMKYLQNGNKTLLN